MNIPLNIDWQQILLHLFNFTILATGLYLLLYKPVKEFMDKRTAYYQGLEDEAKTKLSEAEAARTDYDRQLKNVETELASREAAAAEAVRQTKEAELERAKTQAAKMIADARLEAQREYDKILDSAQKEVAGMVAEAAEKLMLKGSVSETYDCFLDTAERSVQGE